MRKMVSKRRWKARCKIGRLISKEAILNYQLDRWFAFTRTGPAEFYTAKAK